MTLEVQTYRILTAVANTPEWLKLRKCGVGASESPAILGDSAWGTALTVYNQKTTDEIVDVTTDLMEFGHLAEDIIEAFMLNHPERYAWMGEILPAEGLLQSIEWPWLLGTLDRMIRTPLGLLVPLELKSVNDFVASEWRQGGSDDDTDWSGPVTYIVPKKYQVQVQQQMAVRGGEFAYVAVWLGKGQLEVIRVDRDDEYIEEYLVGKIGDFWNYNVVPRVPPRPTINDDLWKVWPGDLDADPIIATEDDIDLIGQWRIATTDARTLKKEIGQMKFDLTDRMGNATRIVDPLTGKDIHTLNPQNTSRGTNFDLLLDKYPDAYEECIKPAGRTRVHRATKVKVG